MLHRCYRFFYEPRLRLPLCTSWTRRSYQHHNLYQRAMSTSTTDPPVYNLYNDVEYIDRYCPGGYHPIEVNDKLNQRYHIVDKLGQGGYSTIWLARDQELNKYVAIKVGTADQVSKESDILLKLAENPTKEFSGHLITPVLDQFTVNGPNGTHSCIVTAPARCSMAESIKTSRYISFQPDVARALSAQLIMATAYVHRAGFVHGGEYQPHRFGSSNIV
jgi:serine/threonine-protein kinase SRPK3